MARATDKPALSTASPAPSPQEGHEPIGSRVDSRKEFGGWLILLFLILVFLYPLQTFLSVALIASNLKLPTPLTLADMTQPIVYWSLISAAVEVFLMYCGFRAGMKLLRVKQHAVRTTKMFLVGVLAYNLLMFTLTLVAEHRRNTSLDDVVAAELRNVAFALSWYLYLTMSKRVAAVYSDAES